MQQQSLNPTYQKELQAINSKKARVLEFFSQKKFEPHDPVTEDMWFFNDIGQNPKHPLWQVLANCQQQCQPNIVEQNQDAEEEAVTVDLFVSQLLHDVGMLHLEILDRHLNAEAQSDDVENLKKAAKRLDLEDIQHQENAVMISYCKNTKLVTDLYKFYSIKFRAGTIHQNYQSIYAEDSNRSSTLALDPLDEHIFFSILGKRLDKNPDEDYREIAQIELPIYEIYQTIKPRHLGLEIIPECYLILTFQDTTVDAPFQDENQIELRFDLRLEKERRREIIERLQKDNQKNAEVGNNVRQQDLEKTIAERLETMQQLLSIFGKDPKTAPKDLQYVRARGIGDPEKDFPPVEKKKEDPDKPKDKEREACCIIQ